LILYVVCLSVEDLSSHLCHLSGSLHPLAALQEALDLGEITSTTTGLELDADSDTSSSQGDDDLSTTMDMNESRTIRRQLEGLESMYSEVSFLDFLFRFSVQCV